MERIGYTMGSDTVAKPDEAFAFVLSGALSGTIAGVSVGSRHGWQRGVEMGLLVFFGISSIKMFYDIWRRP